MNKPEIPSDEALRIKTLNKYNILDTLEEEDFDFLTSMAAIICGVPISLISLVDKDRQWFLSHHGLAVRETKRDYSFCAHAIVQKEPVFIVPDATKDQRFYDNPLVTKDPNIAFYAGVPLISEDGFSLGTLCVIDKKPKDLSKEQQEKLIQLASQVMKLLELRRANKELKQLKTFINHSNEGFQVAKANGEMVFINSAANQRIGIQEKELSSYKVSDFEKIFQEKGSWEAHVEDLREKKIVYIEGVNKNIENQQQFDVEVTSQYIEVDGEAFVLANTRDISKRKKIQRELEATKRILEETNEMAKIGGYEYKKTEDTLTWTKSMRGVYEVDDDFEPSFEKALTFYKEGFHRNRINELVQGVLKNQQVFKDEFLIVTAKGNEKWVRVEGKPIIAEGEVKGIFGTVQDIHNRKISNLELKYTKDRLQSIFYEMDDVMWSVDISNNKLLFVSPSVVNLLGYKVSDWFTDIKIWKKIIHPDDMWIVSSIRDQFNKLQPTTYTFRVIAKDGAVKWIESRTKFIGEESGVVRIDGFVVDKTRERELEFKLKNEVNLQNLLITIASKYININPNDFNINVNDSLRRIGEFFEADRAYVFEYNLKRETATNTFEWCRNGIEPQIHRLKNVPFEKYTEQVAAHTKGKIYVCEEVKKLKENKTKTLFEQQQIKSLITIPLENNEKLVGFIGFDFVRDNHTFTQQEQNILFLFAQVLINAYQKKAQFKSLIDQEERYRNILSNMQMGIAELNRKGEITFVNNGFCDMSGYDQKELLGKDPMPILLEKETSRYIYEFWKKNTSSFSGENFQFEIINKNGDKRFWHISTAPNYNDNNELVGIITVNLDITENKLLTEALAQEKEKAEQAAQAKQNFLSNMSHEIRTPLNVIIGMIRQLAKENLSVEQRFYVKETESASKHLLDILNNILDMSKIESGKLELEEGILRLPKLIDQIENMFTSQVNDQNIEILKYIDPDLQPVYIGDETRLKQVLINLVSNAIKFTPEGYVTVQAKLLEKQPHHHLIEFRISDTGVGISEEFVQYIFEKFTQENDKTNRKFQGTGLGLAISRDLIRLMGGEISVESKKNKGTVFIFKLSLPLGEELEILPSPSIQEHHDFSGQTILLAEDNEMNRMIVRQTLKNANLTILEAGSGREALAILNEHPEIDLILMDIQMPELDGVETTLIIRDELQLTVPIIAITANVFKQDIEHYLSIGMNAYITKPFEEEEFFHKLSLFLNANNKRIKTKTTPIISKELDLPKGELYNFSFLENESDGDINFIKEMTFIFLQLAEETIDGFKVQMQGDFDRDEIKKLAHKIKPNLEVMGVDSMYELIRIIDQNKDKVSTDEELGTYMLEAITILEDVMEELNKINW